ncbi:MAG: universal stress protein [Natronomonas sp.]
MSTHILIPTDGSDEAERGVELGLQMAEAFDATVHALYVIETKATYILTAGFSDEEMEEYEQYGEETVTAVIERVDERGLEGVGVVKSGRISEEIVDYAEDNRIDHIVMGKQGRGAMGKYLGSTAEKVMRMSGVPVTVTGPANR